MHPLTKRPLGKTGLDVSIIGLGGFGLGALSRYEDVAEIVAAAIDAGINLIDNAWEYNDGRSEAWVGRALAGRRDQVIVMSKVCTHARGGRDLAMKQLEDSLRRLRTDHLDIWQIHDVGFEEEPLSHFAKDGTIEALELAKKQGKVRFVGFTGHKNPARLVEMLGYGYAFDVCQFPLNVFDAEHEGSFARTFLPLALERGLGIIGMKSLVGKAWFLPDGVISAAEALRYAMSLPVSTTVSGIDSMRWLHENVAVARDFVTMTEAEMTELRARAAPAARDARHERYKQAWTVTVELPPSYMFKLDELVDAAKLDKPDMPVDREILARALLRGALDAIVVRDPDA